jgi:hypothetical protein
MPMVFDLLYREYCRARLAEMRKQLLIQPASHEVPLRTKTGTVQSTTMIGFRTSIIAAIMSIGVISSASAQCPTWATQNPPSFDAQYPDRSVLNDCELTPAGRMGLERPGGAAPWFGPNRAYGAMLGVQHHSFRHRSR